MEMDQRIKKINNRLVFLRKKFNFLNVDIQDIKNRLVKLEYEKEQENVHRIESNDRTQQ